MFCLTTFSDVHTWRFWSGQISLYACESLNSARFRPALWASWSSVTRHPKCIGASCRWRSELNRHLKKSFFRWWTKMTWDGDLRWKTPLDKWISNWLWHLSPCSGDVSLKHSSRSAFLIISLKYKKIFRVIYKTASMCKFLFTCWISKLLLSSRSKLCVSLEISPLRELFPLPPGSMTYVSRAEANVSTNALRDEASQVSKRYLCNRKMFVMMTFCIHKRTSHLLDPCWGCPRGDSDKC